MSTCERPAVTVDPSAAPGVARPGRLPVRVLVVCTGNAARSVMAGFMLEALSRSRGLDLRVRTAGTHTVDGQPMSARTRAAVASIEALVDAPVGRHRSRQLAGADLAAADLVVGMEADHVRYVRRLHPEAASRTGTLRRLAGGLPPGPEALTARVAAMALAEGDLDPAEDVADPAGHEEAFYLTCAGEIWALCRELVGRL